MNVSNVNTTHKDLYYLFTYLEIEYRDVSQSRLNLMTYVVHEKRFMILISANLHGKKHASLEKLIESVI